MQKHLTDYNSALKSKLIEKTSIEKHIFRQQIIDSFLPDSASFFYIVEPASRKYHFMGKQQESVSGYSNEEFMDKNIALFSQCLHPEERDIILNMIYPDFSNSVANLSESEVKKVQFQYNYRFKIKSGSYRNLLEQAYILETDTDGKSGLILGNVIVLNNTEILPLQFSAKILGENGLIETIFSKTYNTAKSKLGNITRRELDILHNLSTGRTSKEIARELCISPHTVDTHRRNLLKKLNCKSVVELARIAFQNALL